MSVAECQSKVSSAEFSYWVAFWRYFCLDVEGWEQTSLLASVVASAAGAKTKPNDFMPIEKVPQTGDEMLQQFKLATGAK